MKTTIVSRLLLVTCLAGMIFANGLAAQNSGQSDVGKPLKDDQEKKKLADAYFNQVAEQYRKAAESQVYDEFLNQYNHDLRNHQYQKAFKNYADLVYRPVQESSPYWIGVNCIPAGRVVIESQEPDIGKLIKEGGLKINSVTPNSPASKTGLKANDVILVFNGNSINSIQQLNDAIGKTKTNRVVLKVVRDGKIHQLKIAPQARPKKDATKKKLDLTWDINPNSAPKYWMASDAYLNVWNSMATLPKDVEFSMHRKGKHEPVLIFKRGKESWTVRDGKVDELPKDIRGYAAKVYRSARSHPNQTTVQYFDGSANQSFDRGWYDYSNYRSNQPKSDPTRAIQDLTRKVESLQKTVEEMKNRK